MNILKSNKANPIEVKLNDRFDYNYHEALSSIEKEDVPENTILDIIQDGWKLENEVIRYTKVIISKKLKLPEPEPELKSEPEVEPNEELALEKENTSESNDLNPD